MNTPTAVDVHDVRISANNFVPFVAAGNCPDNALSVASKLAVYAATVHASRIGKEITRFTYSHRQGGMKVFVVTIARPARTPAGWAEEEDMEIGVRLADADTARTWLDTAGVDLP